MDVRIAVLEWVNKDGEGEVEKKLIDRGIPSSTRTRLVKGCYPSKPGGLLRATLLDELNKAGVVSSNQEEAV